MIELAEEKTNLKLTPIDERTANLIVKEFNKGYWQLQVFFNKIPPVSLSEVKDFFINRNYAYVRKLPVFNIVDNKKELIGVGGYYNYEPDGNTSSGNLWLVVEEENISNYYNTLMLMIEWGYKYSKLHKIIINIIKDTHVLAKIVQGEGFEKEGELQQAVYIENKWRSIKIYSRIFKPEIETIEESESMASDKIKKVKLMSKEEFKKYVNIDI